MASSNKMQIKVTADVTEAARQLGSLTSRVTAFSKSIKKNFDVALGKDAMKLSSSLASKLKWVALGMGTLGAASLKMAADFEMVKRSMTVLTGSAKEAQAHLNDLERFAATTPFEFSGLVDASKRLQAYGFEAQAVIPILQTVGDAAMAVGLSQEGVDRLTLAFGQIAAKGKLSAEEMRQISETGVPAWKMLAESMGTSVADVMDKTKKGAISAQAALEGIFGGMQKRFGGMMDAVAKEIPQQLSNMKDAVSSIMRGVGEKITQAFDLKERLYSVTSWLAAFAQIIKTSGVSEAFDQLVPDSVREALVVIAATVAGLVVPAFVAWAAATIAATWPLLAIGAACGVVAAAIYQNWDSMGGFFTDLWAVIVGAFTAAWESIKWICEKIVDIVGFVIKKLGTLADAVAQTARLKALSLGPAADTENKLAPASKPLSAQEKANQQAAMEDFKNGKGRPGSISEAIIRAKNQLAATALDFSGNTNWKSLLAGSLGSGSTVGGSGKTKKSATAKDDWNERVQLWAANADRVMKKAEEAKQAVKELNEMMDRAGSEYNAGQDWEYQNGFMSRADYLEQLRQRFAADSAAASGGGILDMSNVFNWSPKMKEDFEKISNVLSSELNPQLELLKERFSNNTISTGEYRVQLETLLEKYKEYPLLVQQVQTALDGLSVTQNSYAQSMNAAIADATENVNNLAATTSTGLADAFSRAIAYGDDLGDSLKKLGQDIIYTVTKMLLLKQVTNLFSGLFGGSSGESSTFGSWVPLSAVNANGGVFSGAGISAYSGSIVSAPTIFPFASGVGLMGEAGPEAILPLTRTSGGKLGVVSTGGGNGAYAPTFNITVNNSGSGDMSDEQAQTLGKRMNDAIEVKVAETIYEYQRSGAFKNAFAR